MNKKWISCLFLAVVTVESSSYKIQARDAWGEGWSQIIQAMSPEKIKDISCEMWDAATPAVYGFAASYVTRHFLYGPIKKICDSIREYAPQSWESWITPYNMGSMLLLGSIFSIGNPDPYYLGLLSMSLGHGLWTGYIDQLIRQQREQNRQQHQDEEGDISWQKTYSREENPNWTVQPGT